MSRGTVKAVWQDGCEHAASCLVGKRTEKLGENGHQLSGNIYVVHSRFVVCPHSCVGRVLRVSCASRFYISRNLGNAIEDAAPEFFFFLTEDPKPRTRYKASKLNCELSFHFTYEVFRLPIPPSNTAIVSYWAAPPLEHFEWLFSEHPVSATAQNYDPAIKYCLFLQPVPFIVSGVAHRDSNL